VRGLHVQPVVPPAGYTIEVHVDAPYSPDANGTRPLAKDAVTALCHQFADRDSSHNLGRGTITITAHPGRSGVGPLKNDHTEITRNKEIDHKGE
jgi:hypothetical protein